MKAEKNGGRAESLKMVTVQRSICGMDCAESMLLAGRQFCARRDEVAEGMFEIASYGYWNKVHEQGMKHYNYEALARTFFLQGASSMLDEVGEGGMEGK